MLELTLDMPRVSLLRRLLINHVHQLIESSDTHLLNSLIEVCVIEDFRDLTVVAFILTGMFTIIVRFVNYIRLLFLLSFESFALRFAFGRTLVRNLSVVSTLDENVFEFVTLDKSRDASLFVIPLVRDVLLLMCWVGSKHSHFMGRSSRYSLLTVLNMVH